MLEPLNVERHPALNETIRFTTQGRTFTVRELTHEVMDAFDGIEALNLSRDDMLNAQLSVLTGEAANEFAHMTIRQRRGVIGWIMGMITNPVSAA